MLLWIVPTFLDLTGAVNRDPVPRMRPGVVENRLFLACLPAFQGGILRNRCVENLQRRTEDEVVEVVGIVEVVDVVDVVEFVEVVAR
jgi:hypothetical protein